MKRDAETRARLLAVAGRLFAERGFKKVTVREICRAARANVAAINYHFGDKLGLYREVLQSAIDGMRATTDAARDAGEGHAPDERLRRSIAAFVTRVLSDDTGTVHNLLHREINDPTPALDAIVEQGIRPRLEYLAGLVADLQGVPATDRHVMRCVASIHSQLAAYYPNPITTRLGFSKTPRTPEDVRSIADHIAEFSLGGVRATAAPAKPGRRSKRIRG
jgi:TetR/AcrR family transcriptional regulator, regulator of cefoperazone and chloramphenicol sensitivity